MHPEIAVGNAETLDHRVGVVERFAFAVVATGIIEIIAPPEPFTVRIVNKKAKFVVASDRDNVTEIGEITVNHSGIFISYHY